MSLFIKTLCVFLFSSSIVHAIDTSTELSNANKPLTNEPTQLRPEVFPKPSISPMELQSPPAIAPLREKSAFLTVGLSMLIPGLGHTYLGELGTAGSLFGSFTTALGVGVATANSSKIPLTFPSIIAANASWSYSIFAAYRDVRIYNQQKGYSYKMPTDSFTDLGLAPFNIYVLKKPEVWGGILGGLALGATVGYFGFRNTAHIPCNTTEKTGRVISAFPVGIGEESLFRGYLQSTLAESFGPWGAITLSSLVFGAVHIPNAQVLEPDQRWRYYSFSLPLITSLGAYFGWLTYKNHSLKESVAVHAWYDFALFLTSSLATPSLSLGKPEVAFSFSL